MTPGSIIIRRCSSCGILIQQFTLGSGNTFGATFWTDGKCEAPMLPDEPSLVKCRHCSTLVWIDELETVGEIDYDTDKGEKFKKAVGYDTPSADEYQKVLLSGISDRKKERYIRLRYWWAKNDGRRKTKKMIPLSADEIANLEAFALLLDENDDDDRLMKAEIFREIEKFEDGMSLLSKKSFGDGMTQAVEIIKGLIEKRNSSLTEMNFK